MAENFNTYKNKLNAIKNVMALSNIDKTIDVDELINQYSKLEKEFFDWVIKTDDPNVPKKIDVIAAQISEWKVLKNIIPETSYNERKLASENILKLSDELNDSLMYDADTYYQTYFLTNQTEASASKSDKEQASAFTETISFKNWFGDSVLKSQPSGKPIIYYHGTRSRYQKYDFSLFPGMYFGTNRAYSEYFAGSEGRIMSVYLKVTNPIDLQFFGIKKIKYEEFVGYVELKYGYKLKEISALKKISDKENGVLIWQYLRNGVDWLMQIKNDGVFDGILFEENNPSVDPKSKEYTTPAVMVFSPEQIKSIHGNFNYSTHSADVRFKKGGTTNSSKKSLENDLNKIKNSGIFRGRTYIENDQIVFEAGTEDYNNRTNEFTRRPEYESTSQIIQALKNVKNRENKYRVRIDVTEWEDDYEEDWEGAGNIETKSYTFYLTPLKKLKTGGRLNEKLDFYANYYEDLTPNPLDVNKKSDKIEITGFDKFNEPGYAKGGEIKSALAELNAWKKSKIESLNDKADYLGITSNNSSYQKALSRLNKLVDDATAIIKKGLLQGGKYRYTKRFFVKTYDGKILVDAYLRLDKDIIRDMPNFDKEWKKEKEAYPYSADKNRFISKEMGKYTDKKVGFPLKTKDTYSYDSIGVGKPYERGGQVLTDDEKKRKNWLQQESWNSYLSDSEQDEYDALIKKETGGSIEEQEYYDSYESVKPLYDIVKNKPGVSELSEIDEADDQGIIGEVFDFKHNGNFIRIFYDPGYQEFTINIDSEGDMQEEPIDEESLEEYFTNPDDFEFGGKVKENKAKKEFGLNYAMLSNDDKEDLLNSIKF